MLKQQWTIKMAYFDIKKITFKSSPLKLLNQIKPNLAGMVLGLISSKMRQKSIMKNPVTILPLNATDKPRLKEIFHRKTRNIC
jgi:hypothetical protein